VLGVLTIPTANQQTALAAGAFFVLAAIWYGAVLRSRISRGDAGVPGTAGEAPSPVLAESI
jgi:hypothetical protein